MNFYFNLVTGGVLIVCLNACTIDGHISKEGIYETLKSIDQNHNPSINQPRDEMSYREYELLREENLDKNKGHYEDIPQ